ncbi:MAG TPA: hypothetical protein VE087_07300 [Xanthobacteraceae bacterium]|nr:hypothetical protein [Xanthobacteraceae bacterium]
MIFVVIASHGATGIVTREQDRFESKRSSSLYLAFAHDPARKVCQCCGILRVACLNRLFESLQHAGEELSETTASCGSRLFHPGGAGYDGAVIWSRPKFE